MSFPSQEGIEVITLNRSKAVHYVEARVPGGTGGVDVKGLDRELNREPGRDEADGRKRRSQRTRARILKPTANFWSLPSFRPLYYRP